MMQMHMVGSAEFENFSQFEYVVAVTGPADNYSDGACNGAKLVWATIFQQYGYRFTYY